MTNQERNRKLGKYYNTHRKCDIRIYEMLDICNNGSAKSMLERITENVRI